MNATSLFGLYVCVFFLSSFDCLLAANTSSFRVYIESFVSIVNDVDNDAQKRMKEFVSKFEIWKSNVSHIRFLLSICEHATILLNISILES